MDSTLRQSFLGKMRQYFDLPDFRRSCRATAAFMTPIILVQFIDSSRGFDASFAALCAHNIALMEMRGPYKQRLVILLFMSLVLSMVAGLGGFVGQNVLASVASVGAIALLSSYWRHLSPDYGPTLAIGSVMVFLIALSVPHSGETLGQGNSESYLRFAYALGGALIGSFYQIILWPIRPQHPFRQAVADAWDQLALVCDAMTPQDIFQAEKSKNITEAETNLSQILDKNVIVLDAEGQRRGEFLKKLDAMNLGVVRMTTRITAFYSALEPLFKASESQQFAPSVESFFVSLSNLSRSIATTVITRRDDHFGLTWLRFQRVTNLIRVLEERLSSEPQFSKHHVDLVIFALKKIEEQLPLLEKDLRTTVEGLREESFFPRLPDIGIQALKPLTAGFNFSWPPDPILFRYACRIAALTMVAVAVYKSYNVSHGYWIALTMVVVLQPSYGPTRQRASQRIIGTLAGGIAGSVFAWIHPQLWLVDIMMAIAAFLFAFNLKQRYTLAAFFVTIMVVLSTETLYSVSIDITLSRIYCTIAGGICALVAATLFWPNWEKNRFPKILTKAMRTNRDYLLLIASRIESGGGMDEGIMQAKRFCESVGSELFASLQRVSSDPKHKQGNLSASAALMSSTLRVTRALNVLSLHLEENVSWNDPNFNKVIRDMERFIEFMIRSVNEKRLAKNSEDKMIQKSLRELGQASIRDDAPKHASLIFEQLEKILTELETTWLVLREHEKQ